MKPTKCFKCNYTRQSNQWQTGFYCDDYDNYFCEPCYRKYTEYMKKKAEEFINGDFINKEQ